jgi:hypothetical protein
LPFSVATIHSVRKAITDLSAAIKAVLAPNFEVDNPVVAALGRLKIETMPSGSDDKILLNLIESLESRVARLEDPSWRSLVLEEIEHEIRSGRPTPISAGTLRSILVKLANPSLSIPVESVAQASSAVGEIKSS